jgi:hypothetical protein
MTNVVNLHVIGSVGLPIARAVHHLDELITAAIRDAKDVGVPQGLIVALLQAHSLRETQELLT